MDSGLRQNDGVRELQVRKQNKFVTPAQAGVKRTSLRRRPESIRLNRWILAFARMTLERKVNNNFYLEK
jgi:hypothetical protein